MVDILAGIAILFLAILGVYMGRSLSKYLYGKDYKKPAIAIAPNLILSKKQRAIIIGLPIAVALFCVFLYRLFSQHKFSDFILYCCISVAINIIISFILVILKRNEFIKPLGGYSIAITYIITLIIPFSIYFIFISLILSGFKLPFVY